LGLSLTSSDLLQVLIMTDVPREPQREGGSDAPREAAASRAASHAMLTEIHQLQRRTDFVGQDCRNSAAPGEIPMMIAGERSDGCTVAPASRGDVRTSERGRAIAQDPSAIEFNTEQLYRQALRETVRIDARVQTPQGMERSQGSGVIIDRNGEQCLIATAGHVVTAFPRTRIVSRAVEMPDGNIYPAEVRLNDRANDRAVLAVNVGASNDRVCNPARIGESPVAGTAGWTTGFPTFSRTMMVSPHEINAVSTSNERTLAGNRRVTLIEMTSHTRGGNSGGPIYNESGEVVGLVRGGPNPAVEPERARRETTGNPLTGELVRNYVDRVRRQR